MGTLHERLTPNPLYSPPISDKVLVDVTDGVGTITRPLANMPPIPMGGVWKYYSELVSKDL